MCVYRYVRNPRLILDIHLSIPHSHTHTLASLVSRSVAAAPAAKPRAAVRAEAAEEEEGGSILAGALAGG